MTFFRLYYSLYYLIMLLHKDYLLHYNFTSRFLLMHKLNVINIWDIPKINKFILFFSLKQLETLDDPRVYNYFYFFRFFLGFCAAFTGYKSFFSLGKTTFQINIQVILTDKKLLQNTLFFFANDVFSLLDRSYLTMSMRQMHFNNFILIYCLKDMNLFVEKKTNVGLFYLRDPLNMQLFLTTPPNINVNILMQCFKINF